MSEFRISSVSCHFVISNGRFNIWMISALVDAVMLRLVETEVANRSDSSVFLRHKIYMLIRLMHMHNCTSHSTLFLVVHQYRPNTEFSTEFSCQSTFNLKLEADNKEGFLKIRTCKTFISTMSPHLCLSWFEDDRAFLDVPSRTRTKTGIGWRDAVIWRLIECIHLWYISWSVERVALPTGLPDVTAKSHRRQCFEDGGRVFSMWSWI